MNSNTIVTDRFSNPESCKLYFAHWPDEPVYQKQHENGDQCGGCSFFAKFNADYGLCAHPKSRHHLETVFEHFTCPAYVREGWGPHSFTEEKDFHCRCRGEGAEYLDRIAAIFEKENEPKE
jgi:hypothetical protein